MFSSFSSFSIPWNLPYFLRGDPGNPVTIKPVEIHDVESKHDKRSRALKHLLKLNHVNHSIVYHNLEYHNHMPHVRGSIAKLCSVSSFPFQDLRISISYGFWPYTSGIHLRGRIQEPRKMAGFPRRSVES